MNFQGNRTERRKTTIFVALPKEAHRPIEGNCGCPYCKAHPDKIPMWDTLCVDANGKGLTSTCHYPELSQ